MRTRWIEGRALISEVWDAALKQDGIVPGLEVIAVDGVPVKQYGAERVAPNQSASTAQDLDIRTFERRLLSGKAGVDVQLTLRASDGSTLQRSLPRKPRRETAAQSPLKPDFEFKMLPGNIAYVALNSFNTATAQKEFDRQFEDIAKSSGLIFDVRENGGGNSGYATAILSHLIEKPAPASEWRSSQYVPVQRAWNIPTGWTGDKPMTEPSRDRHYGNPVVVLTSPRTFSAAEDFTADFDLMGRGKIIGEPTGGSTGQPLTFSLPGGGSARLRQAESVSRWPPVRRLRDPAAVPGAAHRGRFPGRPRHRAGPCAGLPARADGAAVGAGGVSRRPHRQRGLTQNRSECVPVRTRYRSSPSIL